jgi:hypothetical protein
MLWNDSKLIKLAACAALALGAGVVLPAHAGGADPAVAGAAGLGDVLTGELTKQLIGLFVVATLLESALTTLFTWRVYREFFNGRAVKTLVMVGMGYAIVRTFHYDVMASIITNAGGKGNEGQGLSQFLSALVLAGGSAAVNQLFTALGLRPPVSRETSPSQRLPPPKQAWVSVRIIRDKAVGEVEIGWSVVQNPTDEQKNAPAMAGVVGQTRGFRAHLRALFFADPLRWPSYGGHTVNADDTVYRIVATARLRDENAPVTRDIHVGRFAERAIVDFVTIL